MPLRLLLDTECEDLERALAVNLVGPFRLTKALAGPMVLRGRGLVVHVSSDAAVEAYPRWGAYGVSKAALDHLGRIWAAELAGTGVRVLTVDPGEMDTAHARRRDARRRPRRAGRSRRTSPARIVALIAPRGRRRRAASAGRACGASRARRERGGAVMSRRRAPARAARRRAAAASSIPRGRRARRAAARRDAAARSLRAGRPPGRQRRRHPARLAARPRSARAQPSSCACSARGDGAALRGRAVRRRRLAHAHRGPPAAAAGAPLASALQFGALARPQPSPWRGRSRASPRLVRARASTATGDALWAALYRGARPVQYAHLARPLPLWAVQTVVRRAAVGGRDAVGGTAADLGAAARAAPRGASALAALTHAAGPQLDRRSGARRRAAAARALRDPGGEPCGALRRDARARRPRVAVGTTVVRALEGAAAAARDGVSRAGGGEVTMIITPASPRARRRRHPVGLARRVREPLPPAGRVAGAELPQRRPRRRACRLPDPLSRRSMLVLPGALAAATRAV